MRNWWALQKMQLSLMHLDKVYAIFSAYENKCPIILDYPFFKCWWLLTDISNVHDHNSFYSTSSVSLQQGLVQRHPDRRWAGGTGEPSPQEQDDRVQGSGESQKRSGQQETCPRRWLNDDVTQTRTDTVKMTIVCPVGHGL